MLHVHVAIFVSDFFYLQLDTHRELLKSEVNNRETIVANEANNNTYCLQKRIKKFPIFFKTSRMYIHLCKVILINNKSENSYLSSTLKKLSHRLNFLYKYFVSTVIFTPNNLRNRMNPWDANNF